MLSSGIVDLDVGGTHFRTTTSTLGKSPYFEALFRNYTSHQLSVTKTPDDKLFVDRCPHLFARVLQVLRAGGSVEASSPTDAAAVLHEAQFFGLEGKVVEIQPERIVLSSVGDINDGKWSISVSENMVDELCAKLHSEVSMYGRELSIRRCRISSQSWQLRLRDFVGSLTWYIDEEGDCVEACEFWKSFDGFCFFVDVLRSIGFREVSHMNHPENGKSRDTLVFEKGCWHFSVDIELPSLAASVDASDAACMVPPMDDMRKLVGSHQLLSADPTSDSISRRLFGVDQPEMQANMVDNGGDAAAQEPDSPVAGLGDTSKDQLTHSESQHDHDVDEALAKSNEDALQQEQRDLQTAILYSKNEASAEVGLFRLSNHSKKIKQALLASVDLEECCQRVKDAGCDVQPEWAEGAILLIPVTEELIVQEGLRLKPHNILALKSEEFLLSTALSKLPRRKRPTCELDDASQDLTSPSEHENSADTVAESGEPGDASPWRVYLEKTFICVWEPKLVSESSRYAHSAPAGRSLSLGPTNPRIFGEI